MSDPSPAARRSNTATWRDPRLAIGILLVAACVVAGTRLFASADDTVSVWAAREDLSAGSSLAADDLTRREVRFATEGDADRYLSGTSVLGPGTQVTRDVGAGELLPRSALGAGEPDPVIEVPLSVPADSVPGSVSTGSVVDVWVTPDPATTDGAGASVLVFEAVPVVAAPAAGSPLAPTGNRQIIVGLDEAQQDELAEALAKAATGTTVITRRS